jgi:hypothetical protein
MFFEELSSQKLSLDCFELQSEAPMLPGIDVEGESDWNKTHFQGFLK